MLTAYIVVASILGFIVTVLAVCGIVVGCEDFDGRKDWEVFSALVFVGYLISAIWPFVLPLAFIVALIYGLANLCRPSVWRHLLDLNS